MSLTFMSPLSEIREQINRVFSDFVEDTAMPALRTEWPSMAKTGTWLPPVEITETENEMVVCAALPGIKPEEITVEVVGNTLVLTGETKREKKYEEKHFHRSEFQYGQFMRRVPLPDYVQGEKCTAECHNGVLEVKIPKLEEGKRKRIEVKTT
jgi:HSP20 family protein